MSVNTKAERIFDIQSTYLQSITSKFSNPPWVLESEAELEEESRETSRRPLYRQFWLYYLAGIQHRNFFAPFYSLDESILQLQKVRGSEPVCRLKLTDFTKHRIVYDGHRSQIFSIRHICNASPSNEASLLCWERPESVWSSVSVLKSAQIFWVF